MSQDYIPVMTPLAPGQVARAAQVNERYENVVAGFERLPAPHSSDKGFSGPVRVGEPINGDHAATRNFVENGANSFYLQAQQAAESAGLSADAAADSEQASSGSALAAQASASLAGGSAAAADQAKIDAQAARDSASGHRLNAQNAATAASGSADQAALSASSASDDASAAGIAAGSAASSAGEAAGSAGTASTHANSANSSASSASSSASAAGSAAALAQAWAESGTEIEPGKYSAKYWAEQAASIVSGGILNDSEVNTAQGWSSQKISDELQGKVGTSDERLTDSREWTAPTVSQEEAVEGESNARRAWSSVRVREAALAAIALKGWTVTTTAVNKTLALREHCEVTAPSLTITLPPAPEVGDEVIIGVADFIDTVAARNGANIMGAADDFTIDRAFVAVKFTYINSTIGWRIS